MPAPLDVAAVRAAFPALAPRVDGPPLVWLDSAATTQKPAPVIEAVTAHWRAGAANVHRAVHAPGVRATAAFEGARATVARTLGAAGPDEVVFCRGATEALNLLAHALAGPRLSPGDEVLVTELEHHANLVPWQLACARAGARVVAAPVRPNGTLDEEGFAARLSSRTRLVALPHVSNALGTVLPVARLAALAHEAGALVVVDGAQALAHLEVDVRALGVDAYAVSGHKAYAPTGIGALWCRRELLAEMPPWQGGGEMIARVDVEASTFADPPRRFEAGTPDVAGALGLAAALDWLASLGREAVAAHERAVLAAATAHLVEVPGVRVVGDPPDRAPVLPFVADGVPTHALAAALGAAGICVRSGHHCAMPLHARLGVDETVRASFAAHSTIEEAAQLAEAVAAAVAVLA